MAGDAGEQSALEFSVGSSTNLYALDSSFIRPETFAVEVLDTIRRYTFQAGHYGYLVLSGNTSRFNDLPKQSLFEFTPNAQYRLTVELGATVPDSGCQLAFLFYDGSTRVGTRFVPLKSGASMNVELEAPASAGVATLALRLAGTCDLGRLRLRLTGPEVEEPRGVDHWLRRDSDDQAWIGREPVAAPVREAEPVNAEAGPLAAAVVVPAAPSAPATALPSSSSEPLGHAPLLPQALLSDVKVYSGRDALFAALPHARLVGEVCLDRGEVARRILSASDPTALRVFVGDVARIDANNLAAAVAANRCQVRIGDAHVELAKSRDDAFDWLHIGATGDPAWLRRVLDVAAAKLVAGGYLVLDGYGVGSSARAALAVSVAANAFAIERGWRLAGLAFEADEDCTVSFQKPL